jgi:RND family efflux transporter MFP subunit
VALAKADLAVSAAKCNVAKSNMDRAEVMLGYTRILSPYDGVVTVRNFHRGAYVRSPDQGGQVPLLAVDRTDLMRVRVHIPERDVPFVQPGDRATIEFDALPSRKFSGQIARIAHAETLDTRTMLAEIDLPNTNDDIRDHMYGRVELQLDDSQAGMRVPSACLVGDAHGGKGQLFVVEAGHVHLRPVEVGKDSGIVVEVLAGITEADRVVVRPPGGLVDGAEVLTAESVGAQASSSASQVGQ